jgi:uncharacterized protein (TIGR02246 family)
MGAMMKRGFTTRCRLQGSRSYRRPHWRERICSRITVLLALSVGWIAGLLADPAAADEPEARAQQVPVVIPSLRLFAQRQIEQAEASGRLSAAEPELEFPAEPPSRITVPSAIPISKTDASIGGQAGDARLQTSPDTQARELTPLSATPDFVAAEVRGMLLEYLRAFRSRDAEAVAACWSESADNRSLDSGEETHGRQQVQQVFQTLFEEDASAEIDLDIQEIRPLGSNLAVVDGISQLSFSTGDATASRFTAIVMKKDGRWMLESVREAATELPETSRGYAIRRVSEFAGRWESVAGRQDVSTHAFWTAGGGFLVRSHTVQGKASDREITEIIGWDPVRQGIRSWLFTSDGGFAEGSWTIEDDHFDVMLDGTTASGDIVTGRLMITRLGPDDLRTEVEGSVIADLLPPTGDMIRTAR